MARRYCGGRHSAGSVARTACSALSSRQGWHDSGIFRILRLQDYSVPSLDLESVARTTFATFGVISPPAWWRRVGCRARSRTTSYDPCSIPKKKVLR